MLHSNSGVVHRIGICCLFSLLIGLFGISAAKAQTAETVDCKNEGMEVSDPSMVQATCYTRVLAGGNARDTITQLQGQLPGAFIIVTRVKAGFRTYVPGFSAQEWLSKANIFSRVDEFSPRGTVAGYETATFRGTLVNAGPSALSCFTFLHNEGNPRGETEGPSGFLVVVEGSYCKGITSDLSDNEIGTVVNAIHVRTN
jgi:hypothetical protein